jgi:hypothetical protein
MTRYSRKCKHDPLISPDWVSSLLAKLQLAFPILSSCKEKDLVKLARAIRHVERYSSTDARRGRSSRWPSEDIVKIGSRLTEILARKIIGRISVATFVDHYLCMLNIPADLLPWLSKGGVNFFETEQLVRVIADRLNASQAEAKRNRAEILSANIKSRSSGERLRRRINELLLPPRPPGCSQFPSAIQ